MSTISIDAARRADEREALRCAGVSVPSAFGWKAMPAPLSNESYLPCKRRWNGSLTDGEERLRAVRRHRAAREIERQAEHLLRRVVREIGDRDERREEVRHRPDGVGHHDDAARAGRVSFAERDPVAIAARRRRRSCR